VIAVVGLEESHVVGVFFRDAEVRKDPGLLPGEHGIAR
jgi:hypothetical protein